MASVRRLSRLRSDERGAELIEFALVFPLLLLVVLGIIDFGFLFHRYQVVTNAAREGARVAVLPGYSNADVQFRVNQYLDASGLDPVAPTVGAEVVPLPGGTGCIVLRPVTVTYPHEYSFVGGIAGFFGDEGFTSTTLQATATMRSELPASSCP